MINATTFVFGEKSLDEYGCLICSFNGSSQLQASEGGSINVQTLRNRQGRDEIINPTLGDALRLTVQICKDPSLLSLDLNTKSPQFFNDFEYENLCKWLYWPKYRKLMFINSDADTKSISFDAIVERIDKLKLGGKVIGLEINFRTASAFGYGTRVSKTILATSDHVRANRTDIIVFDDDVKSYVYPDVEIRIGNNTGTFEMESITNGSIFKVDGCLLSEILRYDAKTGILTSNERGIVTSSMNFYQFKLSRTNDNNKNEIKVKSPAEVTISYLPTRVNVIL